MEPIDPVVRVPQGGWPRAMLRLELPDDLPKPEAIYEMACAARLYRRGVIARFLGRDLIAWPHQSISEIDRAYCRELAMRGPIRAVSAA